jgi:hypothetical protein
MLALRTQGLSSLFLCHHFFIAPPQSPDDVSDGAIGRTGITSHRQNDAELCVTAHHPRECFLRSFERIGLNPGTHATQLGEA